MDILVENLFDPQQQSQLNIQGFLIRSTAPTNVEDEAKQVDRDQPTIQDVIEILYQKSKVGRDLGVVIAIHGYNTGINDTGWDGVVANWYRPLCQFINQDPFIQSQANNLLFLGYRWPSENIGNQGNRKSALRAMPILLKGVLYGGLAIALVCLGLFFWSRQIALAFGSIVGVFLFAIVLCLLLLRISLYFRDVYRATHFSVPDLVELIRQIDQGLVQRRLSDVLTDDVLYERIASKLNQDQQIEPDRLLQAIKTTSQALGKNRDLEINPDDRDFQIFFASLKQQLALAVEDEFLLRMIERLILVEALEYEAAQRYWKKHFIELTFIGHSMGAAVTTQVVRILSDIFDPRSVGAIGSTEAQKNPSSTVGRVFRLGRLILVAPDIPVLTITSGRSNVLRSALRRFDEAYLFSNEGDLALRLASTAANYFSFPARTNTQGYRLGNVTLGPKHGVASKIKRPISTYGILNLQEVEQCASRLLEYLEINVLAKAETQRLDPASQQLQGDNSVASDQVDEEAIADLFTYFDCTEYYDRTDYNPTSQAINANVLILDKQRSPLNLWGYLKLLVAFSTFSGDKFPRGGRDVHGGYFAGRFCKFLIYRLAFLGLQRFLDTLLLTDPRALEIDNPLPAPMAQALAEARQTLQTLDLELAYARSTLLPPEQQRQLQATRRLALRYLSWVLEQKHIQSAFSPERYQVDVLGRDRKAIREKFLTGQDGVAEPARIL